MADLDTGMKARVRAPIVAGDITDKRFDTKTGEKSLLLAWTGSDGEAHERWFRPDELEADPDATPAAEAAEATEA